MNEFLKDVVNNLENYYYKLIAVTPKILLAAVVIIIVWMIAARVKMFADNRLKKRIHDPLLATFIANLLKAILIVCGFFIMFRIIGLTSIAGSLLAGAGISAFVIGFALKDIGENFLAGILLAFKRPFSVGDIIESNGVRGKVISLNLRDTQIKSDGKDIFIPNALLIKSTLINFNRGGFLLQDFSVGLEYGADYRKAIDLVKKALSNDTSVVSEDRQNIVVISGLIGVAPQLNIRYWVKTEGLKTDGHTRSEILIKILTLLKENGFEIK